MPYLVLLFHVCLKNRTGKAGRGRGEALSIYTIRQKFKYFFFSIWINSTKKKFKQSTKRIGRVQCTYIVQEYIFFISFRYLFYYFKYPGKVNKLVWAPHDFSYPSIVMMTFKKLGSLGPEIWAEKASDRKTNNIMLFNAKKHAILYVTTPIYDESKKKSWYFTVNYIIIFLIFIG